ncbi:hypothetical protein L1887_02851 [Cichorium endivia]|nr:hypothetical protein L1887_02851 [Cichorium endivia]
MSSSIEQEAGIQPAVSAVRSKSPEMNKRVTGVGVEIGLNCGFRCVGIAGDRDVIGNEESPRLGRDFH